MNASKRLGQNLQMLLGLTILIGLAVFWGNPPQSPGLKAGQTRLRLGYFPNVTHAPAVVGVARGDFQKALGDKIALDPKVFNAGPEAMEALLANEIDIAYVGPGPAINTYIKSHGGALQILAGACSGGASLVARQGVAIHSIRDLAGKRVAVPLLGGTQDISLRHFLRAENLQSQEQGGTVSILPINNPDILALFLQGELDAAWVPEPWASRLIHDANATRVFDERDLWPGKKFTSTVVVARKAYLEQHPLEVQTFLKAHLRVLDWLQQNPDKGQTILNAELKRLTGKKLSAPVLQDAWNRVTFTADPDPASLHAFVQAQEDEGYLKGTVDVAGLIDPEPLQQARR